MTFRYPENPLITPADVSPLHEGYEVIGAFNAGIAEYNGEVLMLLRVAERPISTDESVIKAPIYNPALDAPQVLAFHRGDERYDFSDPRVIKETGSDMAAYLTSLSYLRIARSRDGHHFTVDDTALLYPNNDLETWGIEDPRITRIDGSYYIVFSSVSPVGVGVGLAVTTDFETVHRLGLIFPPENKDVVLFPERIGDKYYALHRPVPKGIGRPEVWISESDNLRYWGNHRYLMGLREGHWDNTRIGSGAVPFKTEKGWLELYHAADENDRYCMGAVLLELDNPAKIIARSHQPILVPEAPYETDGFFGNVVFSCGAIAEEDIVKLYYGVADTSMACAELRISEILASLTYL